MHAYVLTSTHALYELDCEQIQHTGSRAAAAEDRGEPSHASLACCMCSYRISAPCWCCQHSGRSNCSERLLQGLGATGTIGASKSLAQRTLRPDDPGNPRSIGRSEQVLRGRLHQIGRSNCSEKLLKDSSAPDGDSEEIRQTDTFFTFLKVSGLSPHLCLQHFSRLVAADTASPREDAVDTGVALRAAGWPRSGPQALRPPCAKGPCLSNGGSVIACGRDSVECNEDGNKSTSFAARSWLAPLPVDIKKQGSDSCLRCFGSNQGDSHCLGCCSSPSLPTPVTLAELLTRRVTPTPRFSWNVSISCRIVVPDVIESESHST